MPYKSETIKIEHTKYDKRIKLDECERKEIKRKHKAGMSMRALSREYEVDRQTIKCIVDPEFKKRFYEQNRIRNSEYRSTNHYDKDYRNKTARKHRKYKHDLLKQNKIKL